MNDTPQDGAAEFRGIPLGAPIRPIDPDTRTRYMRQTIFPGIGLRGQERLAAARILVVGAGGLGSPVVTYLARAGVGSIGVVDDDVVEVSNLHRQFLHSEMDSGTPKTSSAAKAVAEANPDVTLRSCADTPSSSTLPTASPPATRSLTPQRGLGCPVCGAR